MIPEWITISIVSLVLIPLSAWFLQTAVKWLKIKDGTYSTAIKVTAIYTVISIIIDLILHLSLSNIPGIVGTISSISTFIVTLVIIKKYYQTTIWKSLLIYIIIFILIMIATLIVMTFVGLFVGFFSAMIKDVDSVNNNPYESVEEDVLVGLRNNDNKLSFPYETIDLKKGEEKIIAVGAKNINEEQLSFYVKLFEIDESDQEKPISTDPTLSTKSNQYAFFWDDNYQILESQDINVYPITLKVDRSASGTKEFKLQILEANQNVEYDSIIFSVNII